MSCLRPRDAAAFRSDKFGKSTLWSSEHLMLGVNAFEPGQEHAPHAHRGSDKVYTVIEGRGLFSLAGIEHELGPGEVLVAPSGIEHGVANRSSNRLIVLVTMSPPPSAGA